jgi:hypothetical protein
MTLAMRLDVLCNEESALVAEISIILFAEEPDNAWRQIVISEGFAAHYAFLCNCHYGEEKRKKD